MSLPVTNLDDRSFQQLVDEAKQLIPKYCPEWTNHNLSDPGVALIELFAWMTEMTRFRLNQVPDNFYTSMLNLFGLERFSASAATADITFWMAGDHAGPVKIPAGTEVTTRGVVGEQRIFATMEDVVVEVPVLSAALTSSDELLFENVWNEKLKKLNAGVTCFPRINTEPADAVLIGDGIYLGFKNSLANVVVELEVEARLQGIGVKPALPPIAWQVWHEKGWIDATIPVLSGDVLADTTGGLNRAGTIRLIIPAHHEPSTLNGVTAHWLRAILIEPSDERPPYGRSPLVDSVQARRVGCTITAEHSERIVGDVLGVSTGKPGQTMTVTHAPVLGRRIGEWLRIKVEPDIDPAPWWADDPLTAAAEGRWTEVRDFSNSDEKSRHFTCDSFTGEIRFGPRLRDPSGEYHQHGAVPPKGSVVTVVEYRTGGGDAGNVRAGTLTGLRVALPPVTSVQNLLPASGGVDAESIENAKLRGPHTLRAGERAVTVADFERLTVAADSRVARARCLAAESPGQPIHLLVVPRVDKPADEVALDDYALPIDLFDEISSEIDARRLLGTKVEIATPYYLGVSVAALITPMPGAVSERERTDDVLQVLRQRVLTQLYHFVNPLTGGPQGTGWPFGLDLNSSMVHEVLAAVEGVERVENVLFFEFDLRNKKRLGVGKEVVKLPPRSLFLSAKHQVLVR